MKYKHYAEIDTEPFLIMTPKPLILPLHDHGPDRQEAEADQEDGFQRRQTGGKGVAQINGVMAVASGLDLVDRRAAAGQGIEKIVGE